ncbi:hypothetical protein L6164_029653 [Bauhinia variegata]|uniref:Uncharacterized protein n=1 Tax=Bauhinia variegata TaxID=167791 RepID=A0ACB9L9E5_BAUVA|nr:hypothetical protein L6164_029653 [Bauhinia variegata]
MALTLAMKHLITVCIIFSTCASPAMSLNAAALASKHEQWMVEHGRTYADNAEKEKRFKIFMDNLQYIETFNNAGNNSYNLGLNRFSDLTTEEFIASYTGIRKPSLQNHPRKLLGIFNCGSSRRHYSNQNWHIDLIVREVTSGLCNEWG